MFSPNVPPNTHSLRPKRSRQAASSEDSIKLPQAKRKRSALRRDTFEPLSDVNLNEIAGREPENGKANGYTIENDAAPTAGTRTKELTLRTAKKSDRRAERAPSGLTLSSNSFYTVAQLPALPDQIRNRPSLPYSCVLSPQYGYALALTHTDALVWPYNSNATTPATKDVITLKLPFPPATATDPLPLAAFTARSASGEPGIIVVSPKWGKAVYWDTLTNASSYVPGQSSNGVQGSIPGMLNGETIHEMINAEPAGFVLTFSHGRVAHLTIRDSMGRPAIGIQYLRKSTSNGNVGLFGSIRNVFGADRRKGTPIVRAGRSTKGQRDIIVVTEDADLEVWDTNLNVGNALIHNITFKNDLIEGLTSFLPSTQVGNTHSLRVLDIEILTGHKRELEVVAQGQTRNYPILALISLSDEIQTNYYLCEMTLAESQINLRTVHPIKCYSEPLSHSPSWRPRLCVLKTQPMTFVLFETAIVLFSLAKFRESPSSQLLMETQALPEPFQDCIQFQENTIYKILGYAVDYRDQTNSCLVAVQAFGVIRLVSHMRESDELDVDDYDDRISAKSKIEQSVFFGTIKQNPLDLNKKSGQTFTSDEIQSAALEISLEILSSTSRYLPKSTPSIDMHMKLRAKALDDLVHHILTQYPSSISRETRFKLLWNAEKLAAAHSIWKIQEEIQRHYPLAGRERTYLEFSLRALHETRQKYPDAEKGETDSVRHWLLHSPSQIDHLMSELVSCIDELTPMEVTDPKVILDYLKEAVDLWNNAYSTAFKFREDNARAYGLEDEVFQDGVLISGYPVILPHPWTSNPEPFRFGQRLIYDIAKFLNEWWGLDHSNTKSKKKKMPTDEEGKPYEAPSHSALRELAAKLPLEVELFSRISSEENIQAQCQVKATENDIDIQKQLIADIKAEQRPRITNAIQAMSMFNMPGAIQLAEKLRDPALLVPLTEEYLRQLVLEAAQNPTEGRSIEEKLNEVQDHAETYFNRFGNGWAYAYFSRKIANGELGTMLAEGQADGGKKQSYLTWFLKKSQKVGQHVGKVSWINDILGENNFSRAERCLKRVALGEETDLWNKKTEICLAKLANLAANEDGTQEFKGSKRASVSNTTLTTYDDQLELLSIQDQLCEHIAAYLGNDILDEKAAEDITVQKFASQVVADRPALKRVLKSALKRTVSKQALSAEQLVDVLTLADPLPWNGEPEDDRAVFKDAFSLALRVVDISGWSTEQQEALRRIIWRRAILQNDWLQLNETSGKDDQMVENEMQESALFRTIGRVLIRAQENDWNHVRILSPSEILEKETFPQCLQDRFETTEVEGIRKDLEKEQSKLRGFVEKGRLEEHFGGLVTSAESIVRSMADQYGEEVAEEVLADEHVSNE